MNAIVQLDLLYPRSENEYSIVAHSKTSAFQSKTGDVKSIILRLPIPDDDEGIPCDFTIWIEVWSSNIDSDPCTMIAGGSFRADGIQSTFQIDLYDSTRYKQGKLTFRMASLPKVIKGACKLPNSYTSHRKQLERFSNTYCERLIEEYQLKRPSYSSNWFTTVAFQHANIPMVTAVRIANESIISCTTQEWESMYHLASSHFYPDSGNVSPTLILNLMLTLPFCGFVYVADYVERFGGQRQEADVWTFIRDRPCSSSSFDCEDASLHMIQSISSLKKCTESVILRPIIELLMQYETWLVIGGIRTTGNVYTPHAYLVLKSTSSPLMMLEGTTLTYGSDTYDAEWYEDASRLVKQHESGLPAQCCDVMHVAAPMRIVNDKLHMYGAPITAIHVDSGLQVVADETIFNDGNSNIDELLDTNKAFRINGDDDDIKTEEFIVSYSHRSRHQPVTKNPHCACNNRSQHTSYIYYIRTYTYNKYSSEIRSACKRLFPMNVGVVSFHYKIGTELDIEKLIVCFFD